MILSVFRGRVPAGWYPLLALPLLLAQHAVAFTVAGPGRATLLADPVFWFSPVAKLINARFLPAGGSDMGPLFLVAMLSSAGVAMLSIKRAARSGFGYGAAVVSVVPGLQLAAVLLLSVLPFRRRSEAEDVAADEAPGADVVHVLQGLLAGVLLIVLAVLVSAVTFGAYGWGLFLLTPLSVGATTAYLANRRNPLEGRETFGLILCALGLGGLALVALALEGIICLILASPLIVGAAMLGGALGRTMATARNASDKPLMALGFLPFVFALEAAVPPAAPIATGESIDIAAPPAAVWAALTGDAPIAQPPGLVGRAGLAYPLRGKLLGAGVGAARIGIFSTGIARERVTQWQPDRVLAFTPLTQPPAMEEMSPYRRVDAPHVTGYFDTGETRFTLRPLAGGRTRLTLTASHVLRIDPAPYWALLARWAVAANGRRVLADIKAKAEWRPSAPLPGREGLGVGPPKAGETPSQ